MTAMPNILVDFNLNPHRKCRYSFLKTMKPKDIRSNFVKYKLKRNFACFINSKF